MSVFCNLTEDDIFSSIARMKQNIDECHVLMLSGGFSAGDEHDGSGKFIANVLNNKDIADAVHATIDRGDLSWESATDSRPSSSRDSCLTDVWDR